jgi:hypothetical protein
MATRKKAAVPKTSAPKTESVIPESNGEVQETEPPWFAMPFPLWKALENHLKQEANVGEAAGNLLELISGSIAPVQRPK